MNSKIATLLAVAGAACGAAAQPTIISGSGATLQQNFFEAAANTNDFIDVDGDGNAAVLGSLFPDQLASNTGNILTDPHWIFTYRVVGSGNGIREHDFFSLAFDMNGDNFDDDMDGSVNDDFGNSAFADAAPWNRLTLINAGVLQGIGNPLNRGGLPAVPDPINFQPAQTGDGSGAGFHIDFSASDVPLTWFGIVAGAPSPIRTPGAPGYGGNPTLATDKDGTALSQTNLLRPLTNLNTNLGTPDNATVYDIAFSYGPISAPVNYGVGMQEILMSDLRNLAATGRRLNGENLTKVTRDSGSGTRNAFMNGIGLDPSFGRGENIGNRTASSVNDVVGPNYQPSNKGGSSRMEATVQNTRLGIGHTGAERGINNGWLPDQDMNLLGIISDIKGGTVAARPTIENVLNGGPNGYNILGPNAIAFRGNPRAAAPEHGGWGWDPDGMYDGRGLDGVLGTADDEDPGANPYAGQPVPANTQTSLYANNILRSIQAFIDIPGGPLTDFTPGEFLASQFILNAAPDFVPADFDADNTQPIAIVPNPSLNVNVQDFNLNDPGNVLSNAQYESFNTNSAGRVPFRTTGVTYTDGNTGGHYVTAGGATLNYGTVLAPTTVNKIAGDFDADGDRDIDDIDEMVAAWQSRNGGAAWTGSADASFEILGDHDNDGNFEADDVRYAADGLAMVTPEGAGEPVLDRAAGFLAVDNAFGGNFFGTTLANGTYDNGDSVADIAGNATTPGWAPNGSDGTVDCADIQYVQDNYGDWSDLEQAVSMDLSADMNGDLVVDEADRDAVLAILDSELGDINLDGVVDGDDVAILTGNLGTGTTYCEGDLDNDGDVDGDDLALIALGCNAADIAMPFGVLDLTDISTFVSGFTTMDAIADLNNDGIYDLADVSAFVSAFTAGCP